MENHKVHRGLKTCFKVYIVEGVALICQPPNKM